ncbi:MAG: nucleotidyltransferase domain-containing protein, partial [Nanoarchaeota archaeon]
IDKKRNMAKKKHHLKEHRKITKKHMENYPSLQLKTEHEIAMDFAERVYKKFNRVVKSIILFGSSVKQSAVAGSDIDIIIIIDDASIKWDEELILWYREELDKIVSGNPYRKSLHINTVKLSTWWEDLLRGEPVVLNVIRYGESLIDFGGFFDPLKFLLVQGKIRATPEAIYTSLQRAPLHIARSKGSELNAVEGLYWAMVDSAHAALIAGGVTPPSPEHIPLNLKETFVDGDRIKMKYVIWFRDLYLLHRRIVHGEVKDLKGVEIDDWQDKAEDFVRTMAQLVDDLVSGEK